MKIGTFSLSSLGIIVSLLEIRKVVGGYCNWNNCAGEKGREKQGGPWCNKNRNRCRQGCGGKWCTGRPGGLQGRKFVPKEPDNIFEQPKPAPEVPQKPQGGGGGTTKRATTTRYWDCSGGACGCAFLPYPGDYNQPAHCHSNAMFEAPSGNPHGAKFYGTAAISEALGGGNWMASGCGKCWRVTGYSPITKLSTTLVLKGANFCPPVNGPCSNGKAHFDIAAPGFDNVRYSLSHTCPQREPEELAGFESCSDWMLNGNTNPYANCNCYLFNDPVLRQGCENFYSLKWDNVEVDYDEVACPPELGDLPCWKQNGNSYPDGVPELCASPWARP